MANFNVSQIELPNKDLLIIKDTTARTAATTAQTTADSKVTIVSWDATNKKLTKTINGSTTDIVAGSTILSGLTKAQVTSALGYTPPTEDTNTTYSLTQDSTDKHKFTLSGTDGSSVTVTIPDNNTTYTFAEGTTNGAFTVTPSGKSAQTVKIHGLGNAAYKGISDTYSSTSTDAISGKGVAAALASLPTPMVFKGSLGTGGTITTLPTASASNNGHSYKVITNGTYAGVSAKAGDMFISDGTQWVYIPSADEPSGTVTSVGIANGGGLSVSGSPITTSGTITISHADTSSQASVNNSGRTYIQDITLDTYGHVTGITSATETVVDTNTTYTIGTSGNNITLTPSSGSAQSITAPYATKALNNKDGESITATYRRLDDPYYDTVYATEEEVGDIIVTGAARFLNTINGSISGNAATATNVAWSGVTGKPTTLGGYGITDAKIANGVITLGSNTITPLTSHQTVSNKGATLAWATTSTIATIGGTDIKVTMPSNPNTNTTYTLGADTTNNKITLTPSSGNVQSITAPYATSAGSAGSATKATQDESGNNIKASYASSISISDHTITLKNKNGVSLGTVTVPDNNTWRGIQNNLTSTSTTDSLSANQGKILNDTKLEKTTYEYNKEISFGSSGKLLIGKFSCYDSNVTIEINSTTGSTYHATAVLATQNVNDSGGGTITWKTYGDASNTVTPNLYLYYPSNSRWIEIYFSPSNWSKNIIHIQCVGLYATPTNICESVTEIPAEATTQPTNTLLNLVGDYLPLAGGQMTGDIIIPKNDNMGIKPNTNNYGEIGHSNLYFYRSFITHYYGTTSHVTNWDSNGNIGSPATSSAASTRGYVNFYNTCAAGGTQTKTTLYAHTDADANTNILLPKTAGTLIVNNDIPTVLGTKSYGTSADNRNKKIKIKINPTNLWMLCFTVTLYQVYKQTKVMISGYNYDAYHWHAPNAKILGSSETTAFNVYFGYDANKELWVGFDGDMYTGVTVDSVTNGYSQISDYKDMFTISIVDELTTLQTTQTVYRPWYRDETVTNATNATNATSATTASKLGSSNVGSATQPIYLSAGTATACTYTLGKSVPSDADFNDTKNTAGSTDSSSKLFLIGATSQAANPQTYSDDQVYVTSGTLQTNVLNASAGINANTANSASAGGVSLYGTSPTSYGVAMRTTANSGKHGYVQGDWGTYFYMAGATNRGWIFCNAGTGHRASISTEGNMVLNGSLTVGGNTTNTSGVRQVYNSTTKSLDFVFVA